MMTYTPFLLEPTWQKKLESELQKPYVAELAAFVEAERASGVSIYPPQDLVFNALFRTPFQNVKVVIMGQDPYHGPGQAHGLSFSVPKGVPMPPSLQNIFKEMQADVGTTMPSHGCLLSWADQGVMLLNAILTVRQSEPLSHQGKGWERFTDAMIEAFYQRDEPIIFVLWGKSAQEKCRQILKPSPSSHHVILTAAHPSPFSAYNGFFGCRHFSKINQLLAQWGSKPIDWQIR